MTGTDVVEGKANDGALTQYFALQFVYAAKRMSQPQTLV